MTRLPHTVSVKLKGLEPEHLDRLAKDPYFFFFDSTTNDPKRGRFSFVGTNPIKTFSTTGGFVTIDNRTFIDSPTDALKDFEKHLSLLPHDPYLPFSGGIVGFVGHGWNTDSDDITNPSFQTPDAWFGLYDTLLTFDHLEKNCWISSYGLTEEGTLDHDLAAGRAEGLLELLLLQTKKEKRDYIVKPLTPDPVSNFTLDFFAGALQTAKKEIAGKNWLKANLAQRFHAPVAVSGWTIYKMLRARNPNPFSSYLRCGNFEISSLSPSSFLKIKGETLELRTIQKTTARETDPVKDARRQRELKTARGFSSLTKNDMEPLRNILASKPDSPITEIASDQRAHYLTTLLKARKRRGGTITDCLKAVLPGSSMTGLPKIPVNNWIKKIEPSKRQVYTGAIGYMGPGGEAEFNTAVRTMVVKDSLAFVHAGCQIEETTEAEEAYRSSRKNIASLFEEIRGLGSDRHSS